MSQDVAVEHTVAGVGGDEGNLGALARAQKHGVLPFTVAGRRAVAADHPEGMAVQVDRMMPRRVVVQRQNIGAAAGEREERIHHMALGRDAVDSPGHRSEEHTSELQSLMRISSAVFCLEKKNNENNK